MDIKVVILVGRGLVQEIFVRESVHILKDVVRILCIFFFSFYFRYIILVHGSCDHFDIHCTYILYILMYVFHLPLHVLFLFSLYAQVSYFLYTIYYLCFTLRCLNEFCLKCFRNIGCQSLLAINSLFAKFFKSLCQDRFYIQQVSMS